MLDEPDIDRDALAAAVGQGWGIEVAEIDYLALGLDEQAWAYAVRTRSGDRFFVKLRRGDPEPAGVSVPTWLHEHGVDGVVAPIGPSRCVGAFRLLLYPFVDGGSCWDSGLTDGQWTAYGRLLAAVHDARPPMADLVPTEEFASTAPARARWIGAAIARASGPDTLADLWREYAAVVEELADRTERLGRRAAAAGCRLVLCHADAHAGNLLAADDDRVSMVDWDTLVWAPRERDLMFVVGAATFCDPPVTAEQTALFRRGYGSFTLHDDVLAYYAHERIVDDIASFAASIHSGVDSDEASEVNLGWLRGNLESGRSMLSAAPV